LPPARPIKLPVTRPLQIEALVAQGDDEVVFHATDGTTGKAVWLRRFFPFGRGGRGLQETERVVFESVIQALVKVAHPALCPVVAGGVDPVDGMPFVAVEWLAGESLEERLRRGLLRPPEVLEMVDSLLEAAAEVSAALGREGMWLETLPAAIVWAERETRSAPAFRIAPVRCLWTGEEWLAANELSWITEAALGWEGVMVPDQAGGGLGAWVNWLRAHPTATLAEIRGALAAATRRQVPVRPQLSYQPHGRPPVALKPARRRSKLPLAAASAVLALLAGGSAWWLAQRPPRLPRPAAAVPAHPAPAEPGDLPLRATPGVTAVADQPPGEREASAAVAARSAPPRRMNPPPGAAGRVLEAGEIDLIMAHFHREIVMEGVLLKASLSGNRKTWYLEFSRTQPPDKARVFLPVIGTDPAGDLERVKALVGKRIRVRGWVDGEIVGRQKVRRPKILIKTPDAVEVVN
jgi:hypothetical protein